jgi:hypothetical protein
LDEAAPNLLSDWDDFFDKASFACSDSNEIGCFDAFFRPSLTLVRRKPNIVGDLLSKAVHVARQDPNFRQQGSKRGGD